MSVKKIDKKNFLTRLVFGTGILVVVLVLGILGGWWFYGFTALISLIGLWEFYHVFGIDKNPQGIAGYGIAVAYWAFLALKKEDFLFPTLALGVIVLMIMYVLRFEKTSSINAMASVFGVLYAVVLMSFLYRVRAMEDGTYLIWLTFISSWGADTCAYCVGILFGKHKMAPVLSPKKSWEGFIGGVLGAALLGGLYGFIFRSHFQMVESPVLAGALLCGVAAVISVFGDLTASAFKRNHDVKDYSHLIPGHGGILDRFDSCIFVAPVIFYLAQLFVKGYIH